MLDALGSPQSVLVLGGASDIAVATVRQLVTRRCRRVVLAVRDPAKVAPILADLRARGVDAEAVAFDAVDTATHAAVIRDVFDRHGDIDLALVAFGVLGDQADFDAHPEVAARAVTVNYTGAVSSGLALADRMRAQGHGAIVFLSSVAGERTRASNFVYGSSKAGMDAFAQGLGDSLVDTGVRVMVVRPGFVVSRMTEGLAPQPFATTPEAVADAILTGLEHRNEIVWVPGILRYVFAIMRHLPRRVWRLVSARA